MEFIEAPVFTRLVKDYLQDDQYAVLQRQLAETPDAGVVMPGTGGFRKLRWQDPRRGKGRRGGLRVIYYYLVSENQIWMMTIYDKDEAADLTETEKRLLRETIKSELSARDKRRQRSGRVR